MTHHEADGADMTFVKTAKWQAGTTEKTKRLKNACGTAGFASPAMTAERSRQRRGEEPRGGQRCDIFLRQCTIGGVHSSSAVKNTGKSGTQPFQQSGLP